METILNKESKAIIELMIGDGIISKEVAEKYFPELADSDDERIRRELIKIFEVTKTDGYNVTNEEAIAWLEKQGEHANFRNKIQIGDKVTRNKDGVLVNLSQLNRVAKKQGESKI